MPICILPWTTETEILPALLDDVFSQFELFELSASSIPPFAQTKKKVEAAPPAKLETVSHDESKTSYSVNVSEFKPDELTVSIHGRTLTVEGKQETTDGSNYTSRSLLQRYTLPEGADVEQIRSTPTENGQLAIEVPKPKKSVAARSIPIRKAADRL